MVESVIARSPYKIHTMEMNVGGDPLRIIVSGYPDIHGDTLLEKYRFARERLDHFRKALILEPRGHLDMWGAITVQPDNPEADIAAFYLHAKGYSPMCGHATIGLARYAVDCGLVEAKAPETQVNIQLPCGLVKAHVEYDSETKSSGRTRFTSVPAFLYKQDIEMEIPNFGKIVVDISFGGVFFAIVSAAQLGLDVCESPLRDIKDAGVAVTMSANDAVRVEHPDCPDINFVCGTIITDGEDSENTEATYNICVYSCEALIARAPCGSGVVSRVALQLQKGLADLNQPRVFRSRYGSSFIGKAVEKTIVGEIDAVRVEVSGHGHYIGQHTFFCEERDEIGKGFIVV